MSRPTNVQANECDGITCRYANDELCAGCQVFYVYNVDRSGHHRRDLHRSGISQ